MSLFIPADILLPKENFENWSVIACDQYTSRPDYWEEALKNTNGKPSALHLIYPEAYLECADRESRITEINKKMNEYIENGVYDEYKNAFIYIERTQADGRVRCGLVGALDLDAYDFSTNSSSAVRATEKTVVERIPPRVEIRKNAVTELPHVMMLADDRQKTVIEPLTEAKDRGEFKKLYDFELMQGGGHLAGWLVDEKYYESIQNAISALGIGHDMTLAVGDGNHSLATAKVCHEKNPTALNRYALAELVNIHSPALDFEPIYRVVENVCPKDLISAFEDFLDEKGASVSNGDGQKITFASDSGEVTLSVQNPPHSLAVGTVQIFLDEYIKAHSETVIDYIHGEDEILALSKKPNTVGILYDGMKKSELFPAVEKFGTLPRKTFSMGHAYDKRYYTEVRKVKSSQEYIIGLDVGGTKCAVTLASHSDGEIPSIIKKVKFPTERNNPYGVLEQFMQSLSSVLSDCSLEYSDISGIGISCGGPLNSKTGIVMSPPNLPGWDNIPICEYFESRTGIPCRLQNDANACALAEWKYGAGKGFDNVAFLTFGTGLGAGLILDGRLYSGASDNAGEIGHVRLEKDGPIGYGKAGSCEGFCSGGGLAQLGVFEMRRHGEKCRLYQACGGDESKVNAKIIGDLADEGDEIAIGIYDKCAENLGRTLAILCDVVDPQRIILGGIYMRSAHLLEKKMNEVLSREALNPCPVVAAGLGETVGDYAALSLAPTKQ